MYAFAIYGRLECMLEGWEWGWGGGGGGGGVVDLVPVLPSLIINKEIIACLGSSTGRGVEGWNALRQ